MTRLTARKLGFVGFVGLGILCLPLGAYGLRIYRTERAIFYPERRPVSLAITVLGTRPAEAVAFPARDGATMRGLWVPSMNGAAVVLVHGAGGDRTSLAPEADALAARGFGVLLYDLPGHGESGGTIRWAEGEQASLLGAADFVLTRPGVKKAGVLGFSLGGVVVVRAASEDTRFAAVALAGTPSDQIAQVKLQWGNFGYLPALLAVTRGGLDVDVRARDLVSKVSPRPVLIVTGTVDTMVPRELADELHGAALEPKQLLVVPGSGHGDFTAKGGEAYLRVLTTFFEKSLTE